MKNMTNSPLFKRYAIMAAALTQMFLYGNSQASVVQEWSEGLGQSPNAVHSFLFEVTFMNIDMAIVEYQMDKETAASVSAITAEGDANDSRMDAVGSALLSAETIAFSMDLQRDLSCGKLVKAMGLNLERAMDSGLITEAEHELIASKLKTLLTGDEERGIIEGDKLMYRVQADGVRVILLTEDGNVLVDSREAGSAWARGIKGVFAGPDSKLRDRLVQAAWAEE